MTDVYKHIPFFERILILRSFFAKRQVKGTGEGKALKYSGETKDFDFVQLSDFLPEAELRCSELGLLPIVNIEYNTATMTVYDTESDKFITFNSPTCPVRADGNQQELQAIGAQISYSRRYLWYLFLDLCTHDELDEGLYNKGLPQNKKKSSAPQSPPASESEYSDEYKFLRTNFVKNIQSHTDKNQLVQELANIGIFQSIVEQNFGKGLGDISLEDLKKYTLLAFNKFGEARKKNKL